jgi:hypothetical protein
LFIANPFPLPLSLFNILKTPGVGSRQVIKTRTALRFATRLVANHAILSKIATAWLRAANCQRQLAAPGIATAISGTGSELPSAHGIVAESPQEAHGRFRGLGAESPVFLPAQGGQKNAPG